MVPRPQTNCQPAFSLRQTAPIVMTTFNAKDTVHPMAPPAPKFLTPQMPLQKQRSVKALDFSGWKNPIKCEMSERKFGK